jgi:enoyl-CoA hydratase/carnithine racemase
MQNSSPWHDPTIAYRGVRVQTVSMTTLPTDIAPDMPISMDGIDVDAVGLLVTGNQQRLDVRLNRPEVRNAQTPALWRALAQIGNRIREAKPMPTAIVISGAGVSFSAGLDRGMFTPEGIPGEPTFVELAQGPEAALDGFIESAQAGFSWLRAVDPISIAVVHGHAVGAGFQLALACDMIIAHPEAIFAMRETSWGLVPDLGGTLPMVRGAGYGIALEACATGRDISADELHSWGLALAPHADPQARADELIDKLTAAPPGAVPALKHLLAGVDDTNGQYRREREAQRDRIRAMARLMA